MKAKMATDKKYGINNVLCKRTLISNTNPYVNIYSEANGIRVIASDHLDFEGAIKSVPLKKGGELILGKGFIDNLDPTEMTAFVQLSVNEYFCECHQEKVMAPLAGLSTESQKIRVNKKALSDIHKIKIDNSTGKMRFPDEIMDCFPSDYVKAVFHLGNPLCIELLFADDKNFPSINEIKKRYGQGFKSLKAETITCRIPRLGYFQGLVLPKSLLKSYGFIDDDRQVSYCITKKSIVLLPVTTTSDISGEVIDGVTKVAATMDVCENCANEVEENRNRNSILSETSNGSMQFTTLMEFAKDLIHQQKEIQSEIAKIAKDIEKTKKKAKTNGKENSKEMKDLAEIGEKVLTTDKMLSQLLTPVVQG